MTLRIPRELVSPNRWNGRHWRVKHRISQDWQEEIEVLLWGVIHEYAAKDCRRRVHVAREVPSMRNFIRDDDNLRFSVKPLLDALKRCELIVNDSRKWIELPMPEQRVSSDGQYWTEIILQAVDSEASHG